MFKTILMALLATQGLCNATGSMRQARVLGRESPPQIDHFGWQAFTEYTGIDAKQYIESPAQGLPESFSCTKGEGPERLDCPAAISAWEGQVEDDHIHVNAGQCISATDGECRTVLCAPLGHLRIHIEEIIGRMWNPLSMRCVLGGYGGILQSEDSAFVIEMGRPL
ncbi:hypothetical protein AK830_g9780 [Neonectria ditissima]|uniref:Ecp2 effector protein domain-containing protein n=1 Tax=Neonectria ditissima TaxID=78410 RepID=A0A0P7ARD7_9HYPO|nr:hypothetical protein AK830_g9780 [Neonectria ditissima]